MKKVLVISDYYYPAYKAGGPARSLFNLINLTSTEVSYDVFTRDTDLGDEFAMDSITSNEWVSDTENSNRYFYSGDNKILSLFNLSSKFNGVKYDYIYLNSFFSVRFSLIFLIFSLCGLIKTNKILIAPRGELTKGAISIKSLRKKIFIFIFGFIYKNKKIKFHFTSNDEQEEAIDIIGSVSNEVIPNMHEDPPRYISKDKDVGSLNLLFLSRISKKKNLKFIFEILKESSGNINFNIAGAIEDENYWNECNDIKTPSNVKVNYLGAVDREEVGNLLKNNQVFILPTLNENYGHAIVEAMINSNVVILSDKTPWNDVSDFGSYVYPLSDFEFYGSAIKDLVLMDVDEFNNRTKLTYNYCLDKLNYNLSTLNGMFG